MLRYLESKKSPTGPTFHGPRKNPENLIAQSQRITGSVGIRSLPQFLMDTPRKKTARIPSISLEPCHDLYFFKVQPFTPKQGLNPIWRPGIHCPHGVSIHRV